MFKKYEQQLANFIEERNWHNFHHIKSLTMAHTVETLELLELFTLYNYQDHLNEVQEEIGDCFMTLFSIYQILHFDIHEHIKACNNIELTAYRELKKEYPKLISPEFLTKFLSLRAGFLLEAFTWSTEEESIQYKNTLPHKTLLLPFKILLALCHTLNFSALTSMNNKLSINAKKYTLELSKDMEKLKLKREKKIQKRGE